VIVHSEVDRKGLFKFLQTEENCSNLNLTGTVLISVDWLTSEHFQLLNCPAWYFVLLCMRYRCPFYHVPKQDVLVTYFESARMFCSSCNA